MVNNIIDTKIFVKRNKPPSLLSPILSDVLEVNISKQLCFIQGIWYIFQVRQQKLIQQKVKVKMLRLNQ